MALQARASRNLTSCARRRKTPRSSASIATTKRLKRIQKRIKESPGRFCISVAILQTLREHARERLTAECAENRGERREILLPDFFAFFAAVPCELCGKSFLRRWDYFFSSHKRTDSTNTHPPNSQHS